MLYIRHQNGELDINDCIYQKNFLIIDKTLLKENLNSGLTQKEVKPWEKMRQNTD